MYDAGFGDGINTSQIGCCLENNGIGAIIQIQMGRMDIGSNGQVIWSFKGAKKRDWIFLT